MGDSCMTEADCGVTGSWTRIYPYCLHWLLGTDSLWRNTLLNIDIVGKALVLPQSNMLDFGDYPLEALPSLSSGWDVGGRWRE